MHDLETERFFKPVTINNMYAAGAGAITTFPRLGIKNSPPYMHDGRLLTLDDTVEFFNLILGTKLTGEEKGERVPSHPLKVEALQHRDLKSRTAAAVVTSAGLADDTTGTAG
jgi:hypothetical protein